MKPVSAGPTADEARLNWHLMSAFVGVNHGASTMPLVFATTLLCPHVAYAGSGLLYASTCLSSLLLSVPVIQRLGQRRALLLAMLLFSAYAGSTALAAAMVKASTEQWCVFLPGSCIGGVAASLLWTAYGGYLDRSATAVLEATKRAEAQAVTAELASTFAMYYLLTEVVCKVLASTALRFAVSPPLLFAACLCAGLVASAGGLRLLDLGRAPAQRGGSPIGKAAALWSDPAVWCLSLTNLTFGFAAAFMNGFVNVYFTKPQLGAEFVGFFSTATTLMAAVMSIAFGALSRRLGAKWPLILAGSLSFLSVPALVLTVGFDDWRYWLVVPYLLQGCGRAVFESTNKGVFADFFSGPQSEGAFANIMMQVTLAFALCFFLSASFSMEALACVVIALAALTSPMYLLARFLRRDGGAACEGDAEASA